MFAKSLDKVFNVIFPVAIIALTLGLYDSMWMRS